MNRFSRVRQLSVVPGKSPAPPAVAETEAPQTDPQWSEPGKQGPESSYTQGSSHPLVPTPTGRQTHWASIDETEDHLERDHHPEAKSGQTQSLQHPQVSTPTGLPTHSTSIPELDLDIKKQVHKGLEPFRTPRPPHPDGVVPTGLQTHGVSIPQVERYVKQASHKLRVRELQEVQDAMTAAGQLLYLAMYGSYRDEGAVKVCRKGYRELADRAHIDKDTVRVLIEDFKEKGIVREIGTYDAKANLGKTYEVLSFGAIKELWRNAGILHVTQERRPMLCDAAGNRLTPTGSQPHRGPSPGVLTPTGPVGPTPTGPVGLRPTPLDNKDNSRETSSSIGLIVQALRDELGLADDEAALRIQQNCRVKAPDASEEEIAGFVRLEARRLRSNRRVENPMGLLITLVPKRFEGESWRLHRETQRQGREVPPLEDLGHYRAILHDPEASEPEKRLALAVLAGGPGVGP